jgi:hypothetical protein
MRFTWTLLLAGGLLLPAATGLLAADGPAATTTATLPATQYWFGVAVENLPPYFAKQLKLKPDQGLVVSAVIADSPAAHAGLLPYDLLESLNGKPLKTQTQLAYAANALDVATGTPTPSTLVYRRDGVPVTITLVPVPRPTDMLAFGGDVASFSAHPATATMPRGLQAKNYVLPDGGAAQIGPGYRMNLNGSDASALSLKSIKEFSTGKQTIVLTQETTAAGEVRNTIAVGGKVYPVVAGQIDSLPPELQALGNKLVNAPATPETLTPEQKMQKLEAENAELRRKLNEMNAGK